MSWYSYRIIPETDEEETCLVVLYDRRPVAQIYMGEAPASEHEAHQRAQAMLNAYESACLQHGIYSPKPR